MSLLLLYDQAAAAAFSGTVTGASTSTGVEAGFSIRVGTVAGTATAGGSEAGQSVRAGTTAGANTASGTEAGTRASRGTVTGAAVSAGSETGVARFAGTTSGASTAIGAVSGTAGGFAFSGTVSGSSTSAGSVAGIASSPSVGSFQPGFQPGFQGIAGAPVGVQPLNSERFLFDPSMARVVRAAGWGAVQRPLAYEQQRQSQEDRSLRLAEEDWLLDLIDDAAFVRAMS